MWKIQLDLRGAPFDMGMEVFLKKEKKNHPVLRLKKKKITKPEELKKNKTFAAEGSEAKKFSSTPKSSGEMVIF